MSIVDNEMILRLEGELTTGLLAKLCDISPKSLRNFEKEGLIEPRVINQATGYRYYSLDQAYTVERILFLRSLGFCLAEIRELLNETNSLAVLDKCDSKIREIDQGIAKLSASKRNLENYLEYCEEAANRYQVETVAVERQSKRYAFVIRREPSLLQVGERSGTSREDIVKQVFLLKKEMRDHGISILGIYGFFRIISRDLYSGQKCTKVGVFIDPSEVKESEYIQIVEEGLYLTAYSYSIGSTENLLKEMISYAEDRELTIIDECIEQPFLFLQREMASESSMLVKLQIPIAV